MCSSFLVSFKSLYIMFRLPGADKLPDKAAVEEERRKTKQNVWFTMKAFVAYVALLRLGKVIFLITGPIRNHLCVETQRCTIVFNVEDLLMFMPLVRGS